MNNEELNKTVKDDFMKLLESDGRTVCDSGKIFMNTTYEGFDKLLDAYLADIKFICRHKDISDEFLNGKCDKELLHSKGIYLGDDVITYCPFNKLTLLGNSKATLDTDSRMIIVVKDNATLTITPKEFVSIKVFNNATVKIVDAGFTQVEIYKYSNTANIETEGYCITIHERV